MRFANRRPMRLMTVDLPRKWSTRNTCSSGTSRCSSRLSDCAEARSVPNGFSIASTIPAGRSSVASVLQASTVTAGGRAKYRATRPVAASSTRRSASGSVTSART